MLLRGRVAEVTRGAAGFTLKILRLASGAPEIVATDLAFDCSGFRPDLDQPLIGSLFEQGLACPDPHRLGLVVERNGQVLGARGGQTEGLFAIGALGQGTLWEITAVPEIVTQADQAAQSLASLPEVQATAERIGGLAATGS